VSPSNLPTILADPAVEAVKVEVQVAVPAVAPGTKEQVVNAPVTPDTVKLAVPVGVTARPEVDESETITVQVEP